MSYMDSAQEMPPLVRTYSTASERESREQCRHEWIQSLAEVGYFPESYEWDGEVLTVTWEFDHAWGNCEYGPCPLHAIITPSMRASLEARRREESRPSGPLVVRRARRATRDDIDDLPF